MSASRHQHTHAQKREKEAKRGKWLQIFSFTDRHGAPMMENSILDRTHHLSISINERKYISSLDEMRQQPDGLHGCHSWGPHNAHPFPPRVSIWITKWLLMNLISTMRLHEICRSDSFLSRASDNRKTWADGRSWAGAEGGETRADEISATCSISHATLHFIS